MTALRPWMLALAVFQGLSTLVGSVELLLVPRWFTPMLRGTSFADHTTVAALLLGAVVGGAQWVAVAVHRHVARWTPAAHTLAGTVMLGWIASECLVLDSFTWPHALWGGLGAAQLLLVTASLGAFRPQDAATARP